MPFQTRFLVAALALSGLGLVVACAQTKAATEGGDCFAATDCEVGLICTVAKDGRRACTKDLTDTTKVPGSSGGSSGADATTSSDSAPKPDAPVTKDADVPVQDAGIDAPIVVVDAGSDAAKDSASD